MAKYLKDFRQGDTKKIRIKYENDITGWQFKITLLTDFGAAPELEVTTTAGDYVEDSPTEGLCYLVIDSDVSSLITPKKYYYYIQRIVAGAPDDIKTILPPIKDYKDKLEIVDGAN